MNKRITQLVSRGIGVAATALLSAIGLEDDGTIATNIETIATAVVAIGAFFLDFTIHKVETGSIFATPGDTSKKESD